MERFKKHPTIFIQVKEMGFFLSTTLVEETGLAALHFDLMAFAF